jgi:hypothetical protein
MEQQIARVFLTGGFGALELHQQLIFVSGEQL